MPATEARSAERQSGGPGPSAPSRGEARHGRPAWSGKHPGCPLRVVQRQLIEHMVDGTHREQANVRAFAVPSFRKSIAEQDCPLQRLQEMIPNALQPTVAHGP